MSTDYNRLKKRLQIVPDYEVIRMLFAFFGGAISTYTSLVLSKTIVRVTGDFYSKQYQYSILQYQHQIREINDTAFQTLQQTAQSGIFFAAAYVIILALLLFFIPVGLSLLLSAFSKKRRIIPPLYMQFIVYSCAIIYFAIHHPFANLGEQYFNLLLPIGMYVFIAGALQDRFVIWVMGLPSEGMLHYTLKTQSPTDVVAGKLADENVRETLQIYSVVERNNNEKIFKCKRRSLNMIIQLRPESYGSTINVVVFERGMYDIKKSSGKLEEYEKQQRHYLRGVFSDTEEPIRFEEQIESGSSKRFADEIREDAKGAYTEIEGIGVSATFKILMFIAAIGVTIWLLVIPADKTVGFGSLVLVLLYLAFELRDKIGKRKKII